MQAVGEMIPLAAVWMLHIIAFTEDTVLK
jgi:hypothetical protein